MMKFATIQALAGEFVHLDERRLHLERECRDLKKNLDDLKEEIQKMVGVADIMNVPQVITIGNFCISQVKKHREVQAYEYDYVEFKVVEVPTNPKG